MAEGSLRQTPLDCLDVTITYGKLFYGISAKQVDVDASFVGLTVRSAIPHQVCAQLHDWLKFNFAHKLPSGVIVASADALHRRGKKLQRSYQNLQRERGVDRDKLKATPLPLQDL